MTAIWLFLKGIPLWVWAVIALLVAGWLYGQHQYGAGESARQAQWDAQKAKDQAEIARLTALRSKVTVKVETVYVDRIKVVTEKARVIEKVREVFVPTDSGSLPGAFRLFYDGALTGTVPEASAIPDAAPVPIADVADTHARNAELCRIAYATVDGWQSWAAEQVKVR